MQYLHDSLQRNRQTALTKKRLNQRMLELNQEQLLVSEKMRTARTNEDSIRLFNQLQEINFELSYLERLSREEKKPEEVKTYDRQVTPGDEDRIKALVNELHSERAEEAKNQSWMEDNAEYLEKDFQSLFDDQENLENDIAEVKAQLRQNIEQ